MSRTPVRRRAASTALAFALGVSLVARDGFALRAGAASVAMEVQAGTPLGGYGGVDARLSTGELDASESRALVLEDRELRVAIATLDVVIVRPRIREAVLERVAGLDLDGVMLVATHTHSGPGGYLPGWIASHVAGGGAYDVRHEARLANAAGDAIRRAAAALAPAQTRSVRGGCRVAHNRRHPDGAGETDLPVIQIVHEEGRPLALLFSYGVHAVALGPTSTRSSSDLIGAARRTLDTRFGVSLFLPGPLGDQNPLPGGLSPWSDRVDQQEATMRELGASLAACVEGAIGAAGATQSRVGGPNAPPALRFVEHWVSTPAFAPRRGGLVWLASWLAPDTMDAFFSKRVPVQALDLGDARIVALPVEPSHALGDVLRASMPPTRTPVVVAHANDWLGYALAHDDFETGGYEANLSPFGAAAGAWVVEQGERVARALGDAETTAAANDSLRAN